MSYLKVYRSNVAGKVPTVNDIDLESIGINTVDGLAWIKKKSESGIESIVPLGGGSSGGSDHVRLHAINDPLDHAPVSAEYRDKILHTNATTGIIDFISFRNDVRASGSTDSSVVTETGIRAAIDAAVGSVTGPWAVSGSNIYNTNSGNVGIGTNSPGQKLDVNGIIQINRGSNLNVTNLNIMAGATPISVFQYNTDYPNSNVVLNARNSWNLAFYTNDTEKMRLTSSGNVGIGTNSPAYRLDVKGTAATHAIRSDIGLDIYPVPDPGAPTGVVSSGGSVDTGNHYYSVTFYTAIGETHPTYSAIIATTAGNNTVTLTIPTSSDPRVIGRKIYRTKAGQLQYQDYYLAAIGDNTTTVYVDTAADSALTVGPGAANFRLNTTTKQVTLNGTRILFAESRLTAFGLNAGANLTTAGRCTFVGRGAGQSVTSGSDNHFFGEGCGAATTTGDSNCGFGYGTMNSQTVGGGNTAFGHDSCFYNSGGNHNVAVGAFSLFGVNGTSFSYNTAVGYYSGYAIRGNSNVFLGYFAGAFETRNNRLIIDSINRGSESRGRSEALIYGITNSTPSSQILSLGGGGRVGIGTTSPSSLLDVSGTVTAYTAKLSAVGTVAAAQLLGLDASQNLTTNVLPLVLSGIQNHTAGAGLSGLAYNGSAAVTWSVDFSGTGAANSAARSDHNHDSQYSAIGHNHYLMSLADVLIDSLANGQVLRYNSTLDAWENSNSDQYWTRASGEISPVIANDRLYIYTEDSVNPGIYAYNKTGVALRGYSESSYGLSVTSQNSSAILAGSVNGNGIYASSNNSTGGYFYSGNHYAVYATASPTSTNTIHRVLGIGRQTTGTAAPGIGVGFNFSVELSDNTIPVTGSIENVLTNVTPGSQSSDFIFSLANSGSALVERFRLKGNGDSYLYADSYQTKENGAVHHLRGYHNYTGAPGYLKSGDYAGSLVFDAWSGASSYASVGAISVLATADHNSSNFASKMEFWLAEPSSLYPRQVAELTPEGKIKGIYGFSVFGADGITGTQTIITGVSYDSGTMILTFTRSFLSVSGGIVTAVSAASNLTIPLSS